MGEPALIAVKEAAARLGIPRGTLYDLCLRKAVPHRRIGSRVYFTAADLERIVEGSRVEAEDPPSRTRLAVPAPIAPRPRRGQAMPPEEDWRAVLDRLRAQGM